MSIRSIIESVEHTLSQFKSQVEEAQQQLSDSKQQLFQRVQTIADSPSSAKIKLNIGGTTFNTTEQTLIGNTKFQDTFFTAILDNDSQWQPDSDGEYYINRSSTAFVHVLDYLRDGIMVCV